MSASPVPQPLRIGWKTRSNSWTPLIPPRRPTSSEAASKAMVEVPARELLSHALITGQSGSGKSFFLGRLIEEIMIRTSARCVVVDPNDDFARVLDPLPGDPRKPETGPWAWGPRTFTEDSRADFAARWSRVPVFIKSARVGRSKSREAGKTVEVRSPKFYWHDIPAELVASIVAPGDDPHLRRTLLGIHQFVQAAGRAYLDANERMRDDLGVLAKHVIFGERGWLLPDTPNLPSPGTWRAIVGMNSQEWEIYLRFMSRCTTAYPFAAGANAEYKADPDAERGRLDILDVASVDDPEVRALSIGALVRNEWTRSRELWTAAGDGEKGAFFPTFLVLDEAHNVVPQEAGSPYASVLRDQVRTIAAEGRKYGLFVVLSTQRPDKLDAHVVSECRNSAVLRMVSRSVLDVACDLLGVNRTRAKPVLEVEAGQGLGLLFGSWAGAGEHTGTRFKGAARRTPEGGTSVDEAWQLPLHGSLRPTQRSR